MRWPSQAAAESPRPSGLSVEMTARFRGRSQREARGNSGRACLGGTGQVWAPAHPGKASSGANSGDTILRIPGTPYLILDSGVAPP